MIIFCLYAISIPFPLYFSFFGMYMIVSVGGNFFLLYMIKLKRGFTIGVEECEAEVRNETVRLYVWQSKGSQLKFLAGERMFCNL